MPYFLSETYWPASNSCPLLFGSRDIYKVLGPAAAGRSCRHYGHYALSATALGDPRGRRSFKPCV